MPEPIWPAPMTPTVLMSTTASVLTTESAHFRGSFLTRVWRGAASGLLRRNRSGRFGDAPWLRRHGRRSFREQPVAQRVNPAEFSAVRPPDDPEAEVGGDVVLERAHQPPGPQIL